MPVLVLPPLPGSPRWKAEKDPRERFRFLTEAIVCEQSEKLPSLEMLEGLHDTREAYRAYCVKWLAETKGVNDSRAWDAAHNICIAKNVVGNFQRYKRRQIQRGINALVEERRRENRPLRLACPKARQEGVTTEWAVQITLEVVRGEGEKALVVAQSDPDAQLIFEEKFKYIVENSKAMPDVGRSNTTELLFPGINGHILVRSAAGRLGVARGGGKLKAFLWSEAAYAPPEKAQDLVNGVRQRFPAGFYMDVWESTGNGEDNLYAIEAWKAWRSHQAVLEGRPPDPEAMEIMFLPWFLRDEAEKGIPFVNDEQKHDFEKSLRDDEKLVRDEFQLQLEQMNWYRMIYNSKITGATPALKLLMLRAEYPSRFEDCFVSATACAFDETRLNALGLKAEMPIWQGNLQASSGRREGFTPLWDPKKHDWEKITPNPVLIDADNGYVRMWKRPKVGHRYCMGVDLASTGNEQSDWTEMYVIDRDMREVVAHFRAQLPDSMDALEPCRLLSKLYNDAGINPEVAFMQPFVNALSKTDRKDCLYWREEADESTVQKKYVRKFGWVATNATIINLVELMREKLGNEPWFFFDKHLISQMKSYRQGKTDQGRPTFGAAPGGNDDGVRALGLALVHDRDMRLVGAGPQRYRKPEPMKMPTPSEMMKGHFEYEDKMSEEAQGGGWPWG